jgi:hypothetical protein
VVEGKAAAITTPPMNVRRSPTAIERHILPSGEELIEFARHFGPGAAHRSRNG